MIVLVFRSHDAVPDVITSPTLRGLAQEWVAINATAEYHRQVAQMGIPGCSRPGDVLDLIDRSTSEVANELLYNLVVHDSYLSSRMVLQALQPRVLNIACGRVVYSGTLDDHIQSLISDVWEAIATYPEHCTRYVALNLTRRRGFVKETDDRCIPVAEVYDMVVDPISAAEDAGLELKLILEAGLSDGAVSADDVDLLLEVYIQGWSASEAAERRDVSAAVIRKRCERTRTRLAKSAAALA
jgi:DNA-directed RNA polymerase specialized sigma24 family protein